MNFNALLAILVLKNIMTQDEAETVVEYLHDKPQSTVLADTIADIRPMLQPTIDTSLPPIGPVGPVQLQEETAARAAAITAPSVPAEPEVVPEAPPSKPEPETDKPAKSTPVNKPDEKPAKK